MNIIEAVFERVLYRCLAPNRLLLNMAAGIILALIAVKFLKYHVKMDKDYITLSKMQTILFISLIMLAVILVSPLPLVGWKSLIKTLSVFITLLVLAVASYMDRQTATFVNGYMVIGLLINLVLCVLGIVTKSVVISGTSYILLICCVVVNIILGLISYTSGDAGLIHMAMCTFVLMDIENVAFAFILCELVAHVYYLLCSIPKVAGKIRRKEKLRFPFTTSIAVGVVITLFLIN